VSHTQIIYRILHDTEYMQRQHENHHDVIWRFAFVNNNSNEYINLTV